MTRRGSQPGSISVWVLVCLIIIAALSGSLLRVRLSERRRLAAEERRLQAEWLAESGLGRAAARLAARSDEYQGETWDLSGDDLGGPDPARVLIAVEPIKDPAGRRIRVQADYPRDATLRARVTRTLDIPARDRTEGGAP